MAKPSRRKTPAGKDASSPNPKWTKSHRGRGVRAPVREEAEEVTSDAPENGTPQAPGKPTGGTAEALGRMVREKVRERRGRTRARKKVLLQAEGRHRAGSVRTIGASQKSRLESWIDTGAISK